MIRNPLGFEDDRDHFKGEVFSVHEIANVISSLFDDSRLQEIRIRGEITNYVHHGKGHRYFSLSSGEGGYGSVIPCVMWKNDGERLKFDLRNGLLVTGFGTVSNYAQGGRYQFYVTEVRSLGAGDKFLQLEEWKRMLALEGLFDSSRKRNLPKFPLKIGIVTSKTGAVFHDVLNVLTRRYPVELVLSPTAVQGDSAHEEIALAIRRVESMVDLIIVARGGGSFEDLFPFQHPTVVRSIASAKVPVISAIGHEVDITLSDLVSDLRAPTPSAAAELAVPDRENILNNFKDMRKLLLESIRNKNEDNRFCLLNLHERLISKRFERKLNFARENVVMISDKLENLVKQKIMHERIILKGESTRLFANNPNRIFEKGFSLTTKKGKIIRGSSELEKGDCVKIRFALGNCDATVERIE